MNEDKKRVISEYSKIFSARLKYAMEQRNLKQVDLVNMTNIDKSKISSYLSGRYMPKQDGIYLLAKALDVDEAWLMGLDVPMDRDDKSSIPLISNYQKNLEYSIQCFFVKNIEATINNISKKYFGLLINEDSEFYPLLSSGDIAIIEENNEIENGKIYLIEKDNKLIIRKVYKNNDEYELSTFNTFVPAKKCNDVNVIGKVVQALSENIFK